MSRKLAALFPALLAQRVASIAPRYEDINDHDALRHDPGCKLLADCGGEPAPVAGKAPPALAGKSTLNRVEHASRTRVGDGTGIIRPAPRPRDTACPH